MVVFYGRQALSSRCFGRYIFLIRICYDIPNTKHSDTSRSDHVLLGKSWCRHVTFRSFRKHKLKTHRATKKTHFWARHDCWAKSTQKKINVWVPRARVPRAEVPALHRKCGVQCENVRHWLVGCSELDQQLWKLTSMTSCRRANKTTMWSSGNQTRKLARKYTFSKELKYLK